MSFLGQKARFFSYIFFIFYKNFLKKKIEIYGTRRPFDLYGFHPHVTFT